MLKNTTDFGSCNTSPVMVFSVCVNVPPLGDEPFVTTAFIKPGSLTDRWELCVIGRQYCIRTAATFHFKPDPPLVPLHLPPTSPLPPPPTHPLLTHHCHPGARARLDFTPSSRKQPLPLPPPTPTPSVKQPVYHTGCSYSCTPLLQRPLTSYFQPFLWETTALSDCSCLPDQSRPAHHQPNTQRDTHTHSSFPVMNDRWPSHWQLGSWCHIITVSPFRQNYQITPVLKRPGRLTGQPTKETQISERRATQKSMWDFTDRVNLVLFCSLS